MNKTIYVVEDNDDIRELVEYLLEIEGYQVSGFPNATTFKEEIKNSTPDAVVLDIMLPDGNGIEICNKLKSNLLTEKIPVLLMSANTNVAMISNESKADDFISKPFDIDDLVSRVRKLLN
ncbi:response regulator transcription factor [Pedobacter frigiditerrae]|uniref:response regulator transcription factor n=1 Tax=Pedobacter frigiditerrae TaxID=2530452 RepID=UPI00292CD192|nr:response regulator transcription factor [Pedobacter frigiditerrae]